MKHLSLTKCLVLLLTGILLSSCYSHRVVGLLQEPTKHNGIPTYEQGVKYEDYRLRVNDEIIYRLVTLDETIFKTLNQGNNTNIGQYANSYRIYADSTVDIPFLRPVRLAGLTVREAQDTLRAAFREVVPDADVKMALYNKMFTVIGEMRSNTYYIDKDKLNIFQALAMTGDILNTGDRRHVKIIRPRGNGDAPEVLEFDIRSNTIIDSKYYYIYPNDVIYVSRTKISFFAAPSYAGVLGIITSSLSLLVTVLNYTLMVIPH
ncbi:MAG: polysaccharide biosynthesis/export family protein [Paludibacteraceae bacterium]|nr:polysaccharide biosynthesis/export family protein [Paludibacteraceae bacterium]